ncbi:PepSY-associated TM helix domain-containing protein [Pseudothauera rhizosphaerae]|uniref:PepSY domain-containing protein n=1 Tax=Pseudothauera rhizosphaerae TaxID=2565932 RepID=A0A4S4AS43_9RHOO|nr:PepSY-associated TM helix domain-containing protein [Pseudothauera rhizosphaerae]THF62528.1 PepSY domain-containing protein [Pseudothauera rhizosphaerae]
MKEHFRQSMAWLHTWAGLVAGWVLFFVFVTGSAAYFHMEITRWMQPEMPLRSQAQHPPAATMVKTAVDFLARQPDAARAWTITLPANGERIGCGTSCGGLLRGYPSDLKVSWADRKEWLHGVTGRLLPLPPVSRATEGGDTFLHMHYMLHYVNQGELIVALCTMLALLAVITGVIVHKKIFKDFFTFRAGKGQRSWLDAHNLTGVMALPFFVMVLYSGLLLQGYMPKPLLSPPKAEKAAAPEVLAPPRTVDLAAIPATRIVEQAESRLGQGEIGKVAFKQSGGEVPSVVVSRHWGVENPFSKEEALAKRRAGELHFNAETGELLPNVLDAAPAWEGRWWLVAAHYGWFASAPLRWLYFLSGLLGCAMIATGMVLWAVKRRARHEKEGSVPPFGLRLVERLNVGVLVGLPVGVAAYFWANRLLPVTMFERADWEVHALFLTWAWVLLYAMLRPTGKAWTETLWLATAAFGLIPLLNWLTTDKHLGVTIPHGDWVLAGVDLTMLALAALFGAVAWKLGRKWSTQTGSKAFALQEASA